MLTLIYGVVVQLLAAFHRLQLELEGRVAQRTASLAQANAELDAARLHFIEAEKLESIGRLAAGVAHEVKNPLMTISMIADYLTGIVPPGEPDGAAMMEDLRDAITRANRVISEMLEFARPGALSLEPQDFHIVAERALGFLAAGVCAQASPHRKIREWFGPAQQLLLDRNKLEQALVNLLLNAIHATPENGRITLRSRDGWSVFTAEIDDTGTGISVSDQQKLFEPFFTTKPVGQGDASAATNAPPAVLIPSTAYFGSRIEPRAGETQIDAVVRVESQIGRKFAIDHYYYQWTSSFPNSAQTRTVSQGRIPFINWKSGGSWAAIANGSQDATIISHANAIKSFGYPLYLTFHHEPEDDLATYGTPADFAGAFRRVVTVFRAQGVTNVAFVWNMMGWSFNPKSGRDANSFYPGDAYVDIVGSDGYNWYPKPGAGWVTFQAVFTDTNAFAVAHNKPWMVVEYGVQEDPAVPGRKGPVVDRRPCDREDMALAQGPHLLRRRQGRLSLGHRQLLVVDERLQPDRPRSLREPGVHALAGRRRQSRLAGTRRRPVSVLRPTPGAVSVPDSVPSPSPSPSPSPTTAPTPSPTPGADPSVAVADSDPGADTGAVSDTGADTDFQPSPLHHRHQRRRRRYVGHVRQHFNAGVLGATLSVTNSGGASGIAFDTVVATGAARLVYDNGHTRGVGLSAKHTAGVRGNSYYEWNRSLGSPSVWYGRVLMYLRGLPSGDIRLVRAQGGDEPRGSDRGHAWRHRPGQGFGEQDHRDIDPAHRLGSLGPPRVEGRPRDRPGRGAGVQQPQPHDADRNARDGLRSGHRFAPGQGADRSLRDAGVLVGLLDRRSCAQHRWVRWARRVGRFVTRIQDESARQRQGALTCVLAASRPHVG